MIVGLPKEIKNKAGKVIYKVEYALDLGDGTSSSDSSSSCNDAKDCRTFSLKQGWLGFLTPFGQFKFGSMEPF